MLVPSLELQSGRTVISQAGGDEPLTLALPIGWLDLAEILGCPVSSAAIERAIELVEEAIGHPRIGDIPTLVVGADATMNQLLETAGVPSRDAALSIDSVEGLFTRLAAQVEAALPRTERLPEDARFTATLIILRELMHHLGVSTLRIEFSA